MGTRRPCRWGRLRVGESLSQQGKLPALSSPHDTRCCPWRSGQGCDTRPVSHRVAPRVSISPGTAAVSGALPVPVTGPDPRTRKPQSRLSLSLVTAPLNPRVWFSWRVPRGWPEGRAWLCRNRKTSHGRQTHGMPSGSPSRHSDPLAGAAPGPRVHDPGRLLSESEHAFWAAPRPSRPQAVALTSSVQPPTHDSSDAPWSECRPQARHCARLLTYLYSNSGK